MLHRSVLFLSTLLLVIVNLRSAAAEGTEQHAHDPTYTTPTQTETTTKGKPTIEPGAEGGVKTTVVTQFHTVTRTKAKADGVAGDGGGKGESSVQYSFHVKSLLWASSTDSDFSVRQQMSLNSITIS